MLFRENMPSLKEKTSLYLISRMSSNILLPNLIARELKEHIQSTQPGFSKTSPRRKALLFPIDNSAGVIVNSPENWCPIPCAYLKNVDTKSNFASSFPNSSANLCEVYHRVTIVFFEAEKATMFFDIIH